MNLFSADVTSISSRSLTQLNVPISQIKEMLPTVVLDSEIDLDEGTPFRAFRFADEMHPRFLRRLIRFLRVASNAGANDVFPGGRTAAIPRNDVVEV